MSALLTSAAEPCDSYDARVRAVEDATQLVLAMVRPDITERPTYTTIPESRPTLDRFDVLEVARFLLDIEDTPADGGAA